MPTVDTQFIRDYVETRGYSNGLPTAIRVTPDGDAVLFLRSGPRDVVRNLYEQNVETGEVRCLASASELLGGKHEVLTPEEQSRRERMRESGRGLTGYKLSADGKQILTSLSGELYVIERATGAVRKLPSSPAGAARDARFSPDGQFVSCIRGYDIYVMDIANGLERAVTEGGTQDVTHGVAEFVAQEEMGRRTGYWWSPDSESIAFEEADLTGVENLYIGNAIYPDRTPRRYRYPRAGTPNAVVRLGIVSIDGGPIQWVDWDRDRHPYMASVRWDRLGPLTVYVQTRDQREGTLYRVDPSNGQLTQLLVETDSAWLNIDQSVPRWFGDDSNLGGFLWLSDRTEKPEIEVRSPDGSLLENIGHGGRVYGLVAMTSEGLTQTIVVRGSAAIDDESAGQEDESWLRNLDPAVTALYMLLFRTNGPAFKFLGSGDLTDAKGINSGTFSKDLMTWVHTAHDENGGVDQSIRKGLKELGTLESNAEKPPFLPSVEFATIGSQDGHGFRTAIIRPRSFRAGQRYPVLLYVYGGPTHNVVSATPRSYFRQQWLADHGFIVVCGDGRGTPRRGRDWERSTVYDLISKPLDDQVAIVQGLGARFPELDLNRVGIYGWSFGGYFSAMAVCRRPDVFHAGVAGAPVIDWADYDTHYTERYMGTPEDNPEGYEACNVLTYAEDLDRPLLLIHGTTDDNVYFTHTLKMHDALFRAGNPHELLALAGATHMVSEADLAIRQYERIARFFQEHLAESSD